MPRKVECEIHALALGAAAKRVSILQQGQRVKAEGFMAQRSLRSTQLVMHIDDITLLE